MNFALNNLLISSVASSVVRTALIVVCVLGGALLVYGAIRRFSRSSWTGLQIVVLFFALFGVSKIPFFKNGVIYFAVMAGAFLVCIAAVLILCEIVRCAFRTCQKKPNAFFRVLDHIFGALNAVFNFAVFVIAIGGFVLLVVSYCIPSSGVLDGIFGHRLWASLGKYASDFLIVAFLTLSVKGGYKLGVLKSVWTVLMTGLIVFAFFGSVYIATRMPGISFLSGKLAALFAGKMNRIVAAILGYGIVAVVTFIIFVVVIVLLNLLINLGVRKLDRLRVFRFFDGALLATVVFAVSCALVCGVHFAVYSVAHIAGAPPSHEVSLAEEFVPEEPPETEEEQTPPEENSSENQEGEGNWFADIWGTVLTFFTSHDIEGIFTSTPISNFFYTYNPLRLLTGNG